MLMYLIVDGGKGWSRLSLFVEEVQQLKIVFKIGAHLKHNHSEAIYVVL